MSDSPSRKIPPDYLRWASLALFLIVPLVALWMAHKPSSTSIPILRRNLPAYHLIQIQDLESLKVRDNALPLDNLRDSNQLVDHYTREPISAGQAIRADQIGPLVDRSWIVDAVTISIPTQRIEVLSDPLTRGDLVSVSIPPRDAENSLVVLSRALVLDIKSSGNEPRIVLAISESDLSDYLNKTRNSTQLILAKRPG